MPLPVSRSDSRRRRRSLSQEPATASSFLSDDSELSLMSKSEPNVRHPFDSEEQTEERKLPRRKPRGRALLRRSQSTDDETTRKTSRSTGRSILRRAKSSIDDGSSKRKTVRRTISGDLSEMRKAITNRVRSSSRGPLRRSVSSDDDILQMRMAMDHKNEQVEQHPLLVELSKLNPMDAEDRAKYQAKDAEVQKLLKKHPQAARAFYDFQLGRGRSVSRYMLAHLVALGASEETVRMAIRANPLGLRPDRDFRSTALHTACSLEHVPMPTVMLIHRKWPAAIRAKNKNVFLPLHNACQAPRCNQALIRFLVWAYPEALMEINKLGDTPLRTAQRNDGICPQVLAYLEQETERVFAQGHQHRKEQVMERQMWGSSELIDSSDFSSSSSAPQETKVQPSFPANTPRMRSPAHSPTRRAVSPAA